MSKGKIDFHILGCPQKRNSNREEIFKWVHPFKNKNPALLCPVKKEKLSLWLDSKGPTARICVFFFLLWMSSSISPSSTLCIALWFCWDILLFFIFCFLGVIINWSYWILCDVLFIVLIVSYNILLWRQESGSWGSSL